MTYQKLLEELTKLNEEQLQQDVTVCDEEVETYTPVINLAFTDEKFCGVLDNGHPVLNIDSDARVEEPDHA